jgi:hypothetical protein
MLQGKVGTDANTTIYDLLICGSRIIVVVGLIWEQ